MGRGGARGFTLLELILVLALIAFASLLAAAALSGGFDGMRLRSAAKEVAAQLRFTRTQALATGEAQRFTIDPAAHRWTAPKQRDGVLPKQLALDRLLAALVPVVTMLMAGIVGLVIMAVLTPIYDLTNVIG